MSTPPTPEVGRAFRWRDALSIATSIALLVAAAVVIWATLARTATPTPDPTRRSPAEPKVPPSVQVVNGLPSKGSPGAPAVLIEYSDFQCPFCRRFATETQPAIESQYVASGQLRLVFRHYPIESIHPLARGAAEASACAFRQNKFWDIHDLLFQKGASMTDAGLASMARQAKVDFTAWEQCMLARPVKEVADDMTAAKELGIRSTPFFLLGVATPEGVRVTKVWSGMRSVEFVSQAIEEVLPTSKAPSK